MDEQTMPSSITAASNGASKPLTRLCALDTLFEATGTVEIKVGSRYITLPIKSVDVEDVQAMAGKPPRAPIFQERRDGVSTRVRDTADPTYMEAMERYNRDQMLIWVCMALDCDIVSKQGQVVWSADNSTHNLEGAKMALKDMGLVDNQLLSIFQACRALTDSSAEVRVQE